MWNFWIYVTVGVGRLYFNLADGFVVRWYGYVNMEFLVEYM